MATADLGTSEYQLKKLKYQFASIDRISEELFKLYKNVVELIQNKEVDNFTLAVVQQCMHESLEKSFLAQIKERWDTFKRTQHELRIAICGDVSAGKSSFINVLMGGSYLPVNQGTTTNVVCEICQSDRRFVEVIYTEENGGIKTQKEILSQDSWGETWKWLRNIIEEGILENESTEVKNNVTKVKINWPLPIFQEQETRVKTVDSYDDTFEVLRVEPLSESLEINSEQLTITFVDYPGIEDDMDIDDNQPTSKRILEDVKNHKIDGFIFIIDCIQNIGVTRSLKDLMMKVKTQLGKQFDEKLGMFVCNKWDKVDKRPRKVEQQKAKRLERLCEVWPAVEETQIVQFSCENKIDEERMTTELLMFLGNVKRHHLENSWLWLIELCETVNGLMINKTKWAKAKTMVGKIHEKAKEDIKFLKNAMQELKENGKRDIQSKTKTHKEAFKKFLVHRLQKYCDCSDFKDHEEQFYNDLRRALSEYKDNLQLFIDDVSSWLDQQRETFLKHSSLLEMFKKEEKEKSMKYTSLIYIPILILFPVALPVIPLIKVYLVGYSLVSEIRESMFNTARQKIQSQVDNLDKYMEGYLHKLLKTLEDQIAILKKLDGEIKPCENAIMRFRQVTDDLLTIYLKHIADHEINLAEVKVNKKIGLGVNAVHEVTYKGKTLARKKIETHVDIKSARDGYSESSRSVDSVAVKVSHCRELLLLRKLDAMKHDEDYEHFVEFRGSALDEDCQYYILYLFMEICDDNLETYWINNGLKMTPNDKLQIFIGAAKGIRFLHRYGVVHRDVKPSNFLIKDGKIKVCDFDHSKEEDTIITEGKQRGTREYHPPEVEKYNQQHTKHSDIYSFGMLMKTLWGATVFERNREINFLIQSCLEQKPQKRPNIDFVVSTLQSIQQKR